MGLCFDFSARSYRPYCIALDKGDRIAFILLFTKAFPSFIYQLLLRKFWYFLVRTAKCGCISVCNTCALVIQRAIAVPAVFYDKFIFLDRKKDPCKWKKWWLTISHLGGVRNYRKVKSFRNAYGSGWVDRG